MVSGWGMVRGEVVWWWLTDHVGLVLRVGRVDLDLVGGDARGGGQAALRPCCFPVEETVDDVVPLLPPARGLVALSDHAGEVGDEVDLVAPAVPPVLPDLLGESTVAVSAHERVAVGALVVGLVAEEVGEVAVEVYCVVVRPQVHADEQLEVGVVVTSVVEHVVEHIASELGGRVSNVESKAVQAHGDCIVDILMDMVFVDNSNLQRVVSVGSYCRDAG